MLPSVLAILLNLVGIDKEMRRNTTGNDILVDGEEIVILMLSAFVHTLLRGSRLGRMHRQVLGHGRSLCVDVTHRVKSGLPVSCKGSGKTHPTTWRRAVRSAGLPVPILGRASLRVDGARGIYGK